MSITHDPDNEEWMNETMSDEAKETIFCLEKTEDTQPIKKLLPKPEPGSNCWKLHRETSLAQHKENFSNITSVLKFLYQGRNFQVLGTFSWKLEA